MTFEEQQLLLQEIFAVPSNTVQSGRFEKSPLAANCPTPGKCQMGWCQGYSSINDAEDITLH